MRFAYFFCILLIGGEIMECNENLVNRNECTHFSNQLAGNWTPKTKQTKLIMMTEILGSCGLLLKAVLNNIINFKERKVRNTNA